MEGNAIITQVFLGFEHGCLTCTLTLEQEKAAQCFGGWNLKGEGEAVRWIEGILKTVGVEEWNQLINQVVRVKGKDGGEIEGIGHAIEDKWFLAKK